MRSKAATTLSDLLEPTTKLGMTAADLARRLGVTPQAVSGWLKGRATPTPETLRQLEDIAGIPMRDWTEPDPAVDPSAPTSPGHDVPAAKDCLASLAERLELRDGERRSYLELLMEAQAAQV